MFELMDIPKTINFMVALQLKTAGSNVLFAAVTEISDSVLKGAEASGFDGVVGLILITSSIHNMIFWWI
jgi:hypothetical protein